MLLLFYEIYSLALLVSGQFGDPMKNKSPGGFEDPLKRQSPSFGFDDPLKRQNPTSGLDDPLKEKFAGAFGLSTTMSPEILCQIGNTCRAPNGSIRQPILDPSRAFVLTERNCYCDDLCWIYNDCCKDMAQSHEDPGIVSVGTDSSKAIPSEVFGCEFLNIPYLDPFMGPAYVINEDNRRLVHIVDDCPTSSTNEALHKLCLMGRERSADFFFKLPVNGRRIMSGGQTLPASILYRNLYCALCNGEKDVTYWTAEKQGCDGGGTQMPDKLNVKIQTADCETVLSYPPQMRPRLCRKVIETCAADWSRDDDVTRKCHTYGAEFVYLINGTAYRNKYCSKCNHIPEDQLRCHDNTMHDYGDQAGVFDPMPYSILLDMNRGSGSLKNNRVGSSRTQMITHEVTFTERCPSDNQIYDPFSDLCRDISCSAGFELTESGCKPQVQSDDFGGNTRLDGLLEGHVPATPCPSGMIVPLNATEYVIYSNLSAYVPIYHKMYESSEYSVVGTILYACAPFRGGSTYNVTQNVTEEALMFDYDQTQSILSLIGVIISLVCLLCQFIIYMVFPVLRNIPGKCVVCLVVALFVGQFLFLFAPPRSWWEPLCFYSAAGMHYAFLAAFFWMNVMAFDIYRTFSSEVVRSMSGPSTTKRFLFYSLYAWLSPAVIVGVAVSLDFFLIPSSVDTTNNQEDTTLAGSEWAPHFGHGLCWFTSRKALIIYFAIPIAAILLINIALFIASVCYIHKAAKASQPAVKSDSKGLLYLYAKLSFVLGLAWIFGFIAALGNISALWYPFILFNSLQGAFICLSFVCTSRVLQLIRGGPGASQAKTMTQTTANRYATNSNVMVNNVKPIDNRTVSTILSKNSVSIPTSNKIFGNNREGMKNDAYGSTSPKLTRYMDDNKAILRETAM